MTIEIHRPDLEALILERMESGRFQDVEELLLQAIKSSALRAEGNLLSGAELVAAMQSCPDKEVSLEPSRFRLPVRDAVF